MINSLRMQQENKNIRIIHQSTVKHLRFHFSFFLLPVFIFAVSQIDTIQWEHVILAFFILHFLMFPASNGYNSYQDRDETPIGGLKKPPKVTGNLFYVTLVFDLLALGLGLFISVTFSILSLIFIAMSRAYSYRGIRLKKFPVVGYITVFIFQGGYIYLISVHAATTAPISQLFTLNHILCMAISSLFIGSMYPLTQIYQHESDREDGVTSISYLLGYHGTFVFSGILFSLATGIMIYYFILNNEPFAIGLFLLFVLPMAIKMTGWFAKVRKNKQAANFENTMAMNMISSTSMNVYFLILFINNHLIWF